MHLFQAKKYATVWSIWHSEDRASWYILIIKPTSCTNFSNLFSEYNPTCFGQFFCPSSGVWHCTQVMPTASSRYNLYDIYLLLCVQCWTPDDGQRNCPKHVEFYSKNKFEKLVHLVGFIIRIRTVWSSTFARWDFLYWVQDADERIQSWLHHKNILWDYRLNIMTRILKFNCKLYTHDWIIFGLVTIQITWIYTGYFSNTIRITYAHRIHSAARFLSLLSCELHNYTLNSLTRVNHLPHHRKCPEIWIWACKESQSN
jgi:hypothetical protein